MDLSKGKGVKNHIMFTSLINASELANIFALNTTVLIDCRTTLGDPEGGRTAYKDGHIPNALFAHLEEDLSGEIIKGSTGRHPFPSIEDFASTCNRWGIDASKQVVVYDQGHGGIAARLWFMLKWLGHKNVAVLNGGWQNWVAQKYPTEQTIKVPTPAVFLPRPNQKALVDINFIAENFANSAYLLVDSRSAERYRGEQEPIDPVAGHIPKAASAPFLENLGSDGLFLAEDKLKERFDHLLKGQALEDTIFYCGSGVTACHNLLALHSIGRENAKLFPGSWSEWITDRQRPIAVTR